MAARDVTRTRQLAVGTLRPTISLELESRPLLDDSPVVLSHHLSTPHVHSLSTEQESRPGKDSFQGVGEVHRSIVALPAERPRENPQGPLALEVEVDAARPSPEDAGRSFQVDGVGFGLNGTPPAGSRGRSKRHCMRWLCHTCSSSFCSWRYFLQIGSVLQWCFFNIVMILVNNEIFQRFGFTFPLSLTTIHFVISYVGALVVIEVLRIRPKAEVDSGALLRWVLPMAFVTCFNVVLAQLSARYIPLHMLLVTKALSPGLTVLIQAVAVGSEFDPYVCGSLIPVMGGMVLAYAPDAHGQFQGDVVMLLSALGSVVLGCGTVVCAEVLLQERSFNLDSINALYQMVPYSAMILAPPALFFEGKELLSWCQNLTDPVPALTALLISGFFAFCLNFSLFYTIQKTSALTFNVAGNLKMAVSIVFAGLLFRAPMTQLTVAGCLIEVAGVGCYGWALFRIRRLKLEMSRTDSERKRLKDAMKEEDVNVYLGAML